MKLAEIIYLCLDHGAVTPNSGACPFCAVEVTGYVPAEEIERLQAIIADAPDWGEQYLREMDERKRQGDRAHKWKTRAEAAALQLRYAIDALEGSPWTGWSTGDARDFLMRPESPAASDENQEGES